MPHRRLADKDLRRSLRLVIISVACGMVFFNITGGAALAGYARRLGTNDFTYGIICALPVALGVFQLLAAYVIERTQRRKKVFLISLLIQRAMWIPVAFVPFLVPARWPGLRIWTIVCLLGVAGIGNAFGNVAFQSWMGDLVPDQIRGRFFSSRNMVYTITGCLGLIAASYFLDLHDNFTGFAIVFAAAAVFGLMDIVCFFWVAEPRMTASERLPFRHLLVYPFKKPNFRRYMYFWAAWLFAVNFASPFFNVYMLKQMKLNYLQITLCTTLVSAVATVLFVRTWGRLADAFGNRPVMAICCVVAMMMPLLWLFASPGVIWVVILVNAISGSFWPGIDVTSFNLLLGSSSDKRRPIFMANFSLFTTLVGNALANFCGGAFLDLNKGWIGRMQWHIFGGHFTQYHLLFIATVILRALAFFIFFPGVKEDAAASPRHLVRKLLKGEARAGRAVGVKG